MSSDSWARTHAHTRAHLPTALLQAPVHTRAKLCTPVHIRAHTHTRTHPCTPEKTSHIPAAAHGLNLINSYQIRVNRKMAEDRKKDRKRKEGTKVR